MAEHTDVPMIGAFPPPPGITPNFVDPPSIQRGFVAVLVVTLTISTLCIVLRAATRFASRTINATWDDYTSFVAWLGLIVYVTLGFECNKHGMGVHIWDLLAPEVIQLAKLANASQIFYSVPLYFTKLSILLQYLRIFVVSPQGITYYTIQVLIWTNLLYYLATTFVLIFACEPREKIWNPKIPGSCINQQAIFILTSVVNVVTNILILILPLNCLRKLQMSLRRKLQIGLVFATGIFAIFTSIIWLIEIIQFADSPDFPYRAIAVGQWTNAELTAGLFISCTPTFPQFYRQTLPDVAAGLRGYWSRAHTSLVTPKDTRRSSRPDGSLESDESYNRYLELGRRDRKESHMTISEDRRPEVLSWVDESARSGDLENGNTGRHEHGDKGIVKTVTVKQQRF